MSTKRSIKSGIKVCNVLQVDTWRFLIVMIYPVCEQRPPGNQIKSFCILHDCINVWNVPLLYYFNIITSFATVCAHAERILMYSTPIPENRLSVSPWTQRTANINVTFSNFPDEFINSFSTFKPPLGPPSSPIAFHCNYVFGDRYASNSIHALSHCVS